MKASAAANKKRQQNRKYAQHRRAKAAAKCKPLCGSNAAAPSILDPLTVGTTVPPLLPSAALCPPAVRNPPSSKSFARHSIASVLAIIAASRRSSSTLRI